MTYIVKDDCINCKYSDCVKVCPVDCFYEGPNMLVIDPDECIDCGVCQPECPAKAIVPDNHKYTDKNIIEKWLGFNKKYSKKWPKITKVKSPMDNADDWNPKINYNGGLKDDLFEDYS